MPITDKFKEMGTVVCGKLEAGVITREQRLIMMPNRVSFLL
jgi:peptide chain release factor subunit 3